MPLVCMKREDQDSLGTVSSDSNPYGYGLMINLSEDQVEALGLKDNPPPAGSQVGLTAICIVSTVTQDADIDEDGDGIDTRLSLQIIALELGAPQSTKSNASTLYGGNND